MLVSAVGGNCAPAVPSPTYTPEIGGITVHCNDYLGIPVLTVFDPNLDNIGRALPATYQSPPSLILNSRLLSRLSDDAQLFWYGHECGHHALGHALNFAVTNESQADCWSIQTLKSQGLIDRPGVIQTATDMLALPGSIWGHLPGPARANLLVACYDNAPAAARGDDDASWNDVVEMGTWQ